ncbi:putative phage resistance protein [Corynebacterium variabile DSM 44702]|uniref:Putative phage resistance protein n=1 Tax=Corynebacterium variabile (strain DSM 44702 / CIP 107183 / JCM 12073 / NCIMB 30131) TaxID=858619 RepID=G0HEP2_CORVD|nr:BREX-2 system phosphatase PglZ [Corynebacterium variabile]AEK37028.1 putative phage resistance protein [Corynebacterium variabile DSM 44702]
MSARLRIRQRDIDDQIDYLTGKNYREAVLVLQTGQGWDGPATWTRRDGHVAVTAVRTPLALRHALVQAHQQKPPVPWTVFLTPLGDADLPADVRDRLRPYHDVRVVDPTRSLLSTFSATGVLPRVIATGDIAETLTFLDTCGGTVVPAPAGRLSTDHLAAQLLSSGLDLVGAGVDAFGQFSLADILRWSASPVAADRWARFTDGLPEAVQTTTLDWLGRALGPDAAAALRHLRKHGPADLLSRGLAAEVLVVDPQATEAESAARQVATIAFKVTARTGTPTAAELAGWSTAAVAAVRASRQGTDNTHVGGLDRTVRQAEEIISSPDQLDAGALLHRSSVCPGGFAARIDRLAAALSASLSPAATDPTAAYDALDYARAHLDASDAARNRDIAGAEAALRLSQFLRTTDATGPTGAAGQPTTGLANWLHLQRTSRSWADLCVNTAWQGSASPALQQVTRQMADRARQVLTTGDRVFAAEASVAGASRDLAGTTLLVEDVLDRVVAPLLVGDGGLHPVLLLVLDGLSTAAANHLLTSVHGVYYGRWHNMVTEDEDLATALAMYPTVTTNSRASLLSGRTATGGQDVETRGLAEWYAATTKGLPGAGTPVLMHKGDLTLGVSDDHSTDKVSQQVEDTTAHPLVAAVLNTVDDALDKSDPIDRQWSVSDITHLNVLLQAAARSGRTVVMVSDHGHVVDRGRSSRDPRGGNSARWRYAETPVPERGHVVDGEVTVSGDRVLTDDHRAVLAVDEDLRYTARKAGYHGGLTLAEASIPVTVLSQEPEQLIARTAATLPLVDLDDDLRYPGWWELRPDAVSATGATDVVPAAAAPTPEDLGMLFDTTVDIAAPAPTTTLFAGLEKNPGFIQGVADARVLPLDADGVAEVLRKVAANNNRMTQTELNPMLGVSRIRLGGALTDLKRIVNVDGVPVFDTDGRDVVLNAEQLIQQFGLGTGR